MGSTPTHNNKDDRPHQQEQQQQQHGDLGDDEYQNPLEQSSRWALSARATALRYASSLGFGLASYSSPMVPAPTKVIWLDALLGQWKAKKAIRVDVWEPTAAASTAAAGAGASAGLAAVEPVEATTTGAGSDAGRRNEPKKGPSGRRPAVINFHGGGFIIGQGTDDGRWAMAVTAAAGLGAVVFSVNYRLAPEYPFPTAVEDCASAVVQLCSDELATTHGIDPARITLSGFSAGSSLALACWVALQDPQRFGYEGILPTRRPPAIAGFALFYPLLDWTVGRQPKRDMTLRPDLTLPKSLTDLIDASYVYPPQRRSHCGDPRLSPGLMCDELVRALPPVHLCLCEYDMLLAEALAFADRLRTAHRSVEVRIVRGAKHAFDKPLPMTPQESAYVEYQAAICSIRKWIGVEKAKPESECDDASERCK